MLGYLRNNWTKKQQNVHRSNYVLHMLKTRFVSVIIIIIKPPF